jgi:type IV secretory pathway VirB2 component (pilin)
MYTVANNIVYNKPIKKHLEEFIMKKLTGKMKTRVIAGCTALAFSLVPSAVGATAPSQYVNKVSDGLTGEIMKVAPKLATLVIAFALIMYLISGDDHKKSKYKATGFVALLILGVLLALQPLQGWFSGFFG